MTLVSYQFSFIFSKCSLNLSSENRIVFLEFVYSSCFCSFLSKSFIFSNLPNLQAILHFSAYSFHHNSFFPFLQQSFYFFLLLHNSLFALSSYAFPSSVLTLLPKRFLLPSACAILSITPFISIVCAFIHGFIFEIFLPQTCSADVDIICCTFSQLNSRVSFSINPLVRSLYFSSSSLTRPL